MSGPEPMRRSGAGLAAKAVIVILGLSLAGYFAWLRLSGAVPAEATRPGSEPAKPTGASRMMAAPPVAGPLAGVVSLKSDLSAVYRMLMQTLTGVKDGDTAEKALPQLQEAAAKLDGFKERYAKLEGPAQAVIGSVTDDGLGKLKELIDTKMELPGVSEKLKAPLGEITAKLAALGGKP